MLRGTRGEQAGIGFLNVNVALLGWFWILGWRGQWEGFLVGNFLLPFDYGLEVSLFVELQIDSFSICSDVPGPNSVRMGMVFGVGE